MQNYQQQFIELCLDLQVLKFGTFTLKSGRISPYFFNIGLFNRGQSLAKLGYYYATVIEQADLSFDMLFGPAYKGIALATATTIAFAEHFNKNIPYCFNRKEVKDHGEGGNLIGSPLQGRVLIIDDVVTAGTAFNEAKTIIEDAGAEVAGLVIALDRQERGNSELSAIQEISEQHKIPVYNIISLDHLVDYLMTQNDQDVIKKIKEYRVEYGATA